MKATRITLIILISFITHCLSAQGIHFEKNVTWQQVVKKAKAEHKMIFVDCYATWCGPCKDMDQYIYPLREVGDVYNEKFINVKIQMDKTSKDDATTRDWYKTANELEKTCEVTAYPTLLFFDSDGNPVHKGVGYIGTKNFIKLADYAQNPSKQFFTVLKNFKEGKIDTASEKEAARDFFAVDKKLAGELAADYLVKIPTNQLGALGNGRLMVQFQYDQSVYNTAFHYIEKLDKNEFKNNLSFIDAMLKHEEIQRLAIQYVRQLTCNEIIDERYSWFLINFNNDSLVRHKVNACLVTFPDTTLVGSKHTFLFAFTRKTTDPSFLVLYRNTQQLDSIYKDPYSCQKTLGRAISNELMRPELDHAKESGQIPNFESINSVIEKKYNKYYADWVTIDGQIDWFQHLIKKNKDISYWPSLISSEIKRVQRFRFDTLSTLEEKVILNDLCYYDVFLHCTDRTQLAVATDWMKRIVQLSPNDADFVDTYADLLYKSGDVKTALNWEKKAIEIATKRHNEKKATFYDTSLKKMNNREPIWQQKEYGFSINQH